MAQTVNDKSYKPSLIYRLLQMADREGPWIDLELHMVPIHEDYPEFVGE